VNPLRCAVHAPRKPRAYILVCPFDVYVSPLGAARKTSCFSRSETYDLTPPPTVTPAQCGGGTHGRRGSFVDYGYRLGDFHVGSVVPSASRVARLSHRVNTDFRRIGCVPCDYVAAIRPSVMPVSCTTARLGVRVSPRQAFGACKTGMFCPQLPGTDLQRSGTCLGLTHTLIRTSLRATDTRSIKSATWARGDTVQ